MNAYPFIPGLDTRQVKSLIRQLRVLRYDYPHLGDEELASEWADRQRDSLASGRPDPIAAWFAEGGWENGYARAQAFAHRLDQQKIRSRALRQDVKERRMDREPASPRQQRFVKRLAERRNEALPAPPDQLSKLAASRLIKRFLES